MNQALDAKSLYDKNFYYIELGENFSIPRAFEKAVELVGDRNLSNILIVADDENTLEYEMFQLKSNAPESTWYLNNKLMSSHSENIPCSFSGVIIALYSDWDALRKMLESNAKSIIFIPGAKYILNDVKSLLKPIKL